MSTQQTPWRELAACAGHPHPELFDSHVDGESSHQQNGRHARARTICAACPVRDNCLAEAMRLGNSAAGVEGVWGGRVFVGIDVIHKRRYDGRKRTA